MSLSKILSFFSDPSSMNSLGITLLLMLMGFFYYYFYSMAPSSNSSEPKIIVSTSTSSLQNRFKYDVFLSFRGEDTRKTFVDHLYHALMDKGIYTYKDDEKIQKGERISDDLFKSIEDSKFYIIVFSKNYASSSWCLEELVKIMECQKMPEHTAYPVFYDVEPTEVRNQSGAVKKDFFKNAEKWREALKEAADLAGWELKNTLDGHEAKFIKKIVQEISLELRSINTGFDEKLVGMETRVEDVVSSLEIGIHEVRMIGIKGMGGAGKTTTARAVFDNVSADFEAKSFVENVREVSNSSGLKKLQEQVLSDVLKEKVTVNGVTDGKNMMKERMCGKKVLLILDDVDHIEQLKALAGERKWFKPGSRILITTRDEQVLKAHRSVNVIRDIALLSDQEATSLFSRYAFGRENPLQGYKELSGKVVRYAAGLPLTLEVLGSFLCGKDKDEWVDAIERLKTIPLKDTMEKLELSYISLEVDYKEIFLDIACILKGKSKKDATTILESCGFHAINGLKILEQRSLITISKDEVLGMHDHIEEMGKNIVRRSHPDEPNQHSRLWIDEEIEDILANDKGTESTRCLKLTTSRRNSRIVMKGLGKMKKLRYLEVYFTGYDVFVSFRGEDTRKNFVGHLYQALMDKGIYPYKDGDIIQKGKPISDNLFKAIEDSTFYIIVFSKNYASSSWCLDELVKIMECHKMTEHTAYPVFYDVKPTEVRKQSGAVGEAFAQHEKKGAAGKWKGALKEAAGLDGWELNTNDGHDKANIIRKIVEELSLELRFIDSGVDGKLIGMDTRIRDEPNNLVGFDMKYSRMAQLWEEGEEKVLKKLKFLSFSHSNLTTFDFGMTPNLEMLSLKFSYNLVELCMQITCQKLKHLEISDSKLRTFDLGLTPNLEMLSLNSCADFEELHVSIACPNLKFLNLRKSRLRSLDLELIPNLESLNLEECDELVEINAPVGSRNKVVELNLRGCALLENILGLKGLLIVASPELLQLYDFPSEIETATSYWEWATRGPNVGKGIGTEEDPVVVEDAGGQCVRTRRGGQSSSLVG
ncbi:disease resistance TIR-NBS-LRR class family protein [Tanacetum coccineum]